MDNDNSDLESESYNNLNIEKRRNTMEGKKSKSKNLCQYLNCTQEELAQIMTKLNDNYRSIAERMYVNKCHSHRELIEPSNLRFCKN